MASIKYVGSFYCGNVNQLQDMTKYLEVFGKLYYQYKENLENYILTLSYKDLSFDNLFERYRNLFIKEKKNLDGINFPTTLESVDGYFKLKIYDPIFSQLIEQVKAIEEERNYFINYVKKRRWEVTDDFWIGIKEFGEVRIKEITSDYAEKLIPKTFVEKCHLKIV